MSISYASIFQPKNVSITLCFIFSLLFQCVVGRVQRENEKEYRLEWEKEKEDSMKWEKVEELTVYPELKTPWVSIHNHTNVTIFISKLHEYRFVFFVSSLYDLTQWVRVHKHAIFRSKIHELLDPFLYFIFVFSLCNTYWGSVLFLQCLLKSLDLWVLSRAWVYFRSHSQFVVRAARSTHSPLSASDRVFTQCKVKWSDSLTSWTLGRKYFFFNFFSIRLIDSFRM